MTDYLRTLSEKVDPAHAAIIVVDMQNAFLADGEFFDQLTGNVADAQQMAATLQRFLEDARQLGVRIIHLRAVYDPEVMNEPMRERLARHGLSPYCLSGSSGVDFYPGFEPPPGELVITKHRLDGFYGTDLDDHLRRVGVRTLIMTGVVTHGCVDSTARHGYFNGYYIVFCSDATAGGSDVQRQATLQTVEEQFGVVACATEIVAAWSRTPASGALQTP
jgi:ureidoacrylate peracid hydrolase